MINKKDTEGHVCCGNHNHEHHHEHHERTIHTQMHLETDEGEELVCDVLGIFDVDNQKYIALLPEGEENVLLYNYKEYDGEPELTLIESDDDFQKVSDAFMELVES